MKIIFKIPKKYQNIRSGDIECTPSSVFIDKDGNLIMKLTNIKEVKEDVLTKTKLPSLPLHDISSIIGKQFTFNLGTSNLGTNNLGTNNLGTNNLGTNNLNTKENKS